MKNDLRKRLAKIVRKSTSPKEENGSTSIDYLKRKLKQKTTFKSDFISSSNDAIVYKRNIPLTINRSNKPGFSALPEVSLEDTLKGSLLTFEDTQCYFFKKKANEAVPELSTRFLSACDIPPELMPESSLKEFMNKNYNYSDIKPEDIIFLDIETTGLSNSSLFLIGTMVYEKEFTVKQYFARDYAEEKAVIGAFFQLVKTKKVLVSFNGRTFDMPFINARAAVCGIDNEITFIHLDLMHISRRKWKNRLPDCRLQTIENHICGRHRHGDIPGYMIPMAYHDYVLSNNAQQMISVLKHNYLDLVTLADIMINLTVTKAKE